MKKQGTCLGLPYDWRRPSWRKYKAALWNKKSGQLFLPKVFGWGYTINLYALLHSRKGLLSLFLFLAFLLLILGSEVCRVNQAHQSFESYYAFRGCQQLLERKETYGICRTENGSVIKIVSYQGKWYLDGDLPGTW